MKKSKIAAVVLSLMFILFSSCLLSGFSLHETYPNWTDNQIKSHQIAEIAREMGLPESDPIILRAKSIWFSEEAAKIQAAAEAAVAEAGDIQSAEFTPEETPEEIMDEPEEIPEEIPEDPADLLSDENLETFLQNQQEELQAIIEVANTPVKYTKGVPNYTQQDIDIVASVVYNEAAHNTTERHKELVAACVVNRVNSPWLGDSVYEVVCWPSQYLPAYAQYGSFYMNRAMESEEWPYLCEIAERALKGEIDVPYDVIFQAEFTQGRGIYETYRTDYSTTYFCYSLYPFDDPMLAGENT